MDTTTANTTNNFEIKGLPAGKDVLLKIEEKKEKIPQTNNKFKSFRIDCMSGNFYVITDKMIKQFNLGQLYEILLEHRLPKNTPKSVELTSKIIINRGFDWNPVNYHGDRVYNFKWNDIECSITGSFNYFWIRVYDVIDNNAEQVIIDITNTLLDRWKPDISEENIKITFVTYDSMRGCFSWHSTVVRPKRSMDTIYYDPDVKSKLVNSIEKFKKSSKLYDEYGVTWKKVIMLHGPPGTGKSSTVLALASHFNMNIGKLTISRDMKSSDVESLFREMPENTILLIEDVDALFTERESNSGVDFSTMLNCMDGVGTRRGLILFMTSNHIEKLDKAFIRPGRVDDIIEFGKPTEEIIKMALNKLAKNYSADHEEYIKRHPGITIPEMQKHVFDCIMNEKKTIL